LASRSEIGEDLLVLAVHIPPHCPEAVRDPFGRFALQDEIRLCAIVALFPVNQGPADALEALRGAEINTSEAFEKALRAECFRLPSPAAGSSGLPHCRDNPDARAAVASGGFPRLNEELSQPKSPSPRKRDT
jgi:hypothetical protein